MRARLLLLGAQTIALGLMMAFLVVPASSLFLDMFGAEKLPYVYLGVAVAGVVVSAAMGRAQRRLSLSRLAVTLLATYTCVVAAAWLLLVAVEATWVTFALLLLFPLSIPLGFVIVGAQAGRLLDVREMKAHFPRVVAGFSVGFALGGLATAWLVDVIGALANLLVFDIVAGLVFIGLVTVTAHRHPAELRTPPEPQPAAAAPRQPGPKRRSLLVNRLVVLIFGYQFLSAAVTQLLDFIVWERAAARYPDPVDLARFLGFFGALINVASVAFVALVAGWLLKRYGIGLGLAANPAGVLAVLVASAVVGYAGGPATTLFFVFVCAQQVTDIALTDGTTRTSINATYQALPMDERLRAQTGTEGAGVPVSLGAVGLVLIAADALGLGVRPIVLLTLGLTVIWFVLAVLAYREYGVKLRSALAQRSWDPVALNIDDQASQEAVQRLLTSSDARDVMMGLDVLADADHPSLDGHVARLLTDPDQPAVLRGVAARIAGKHGADNPGLRGLLDHAAPEIRLGAAAGLAPTATVAGAQARSVFADAIRSAHPPSVREALVAATAAPDPFFAPLLVELAGSPSPPSELADALAANADALVPATAKVLAHGGAGGTQLLRAMAATRAPQARDLLVQQMGSADRDVADAAVGALVARGHLLEGHLSEVRIAVLTHLKRAARALDALSVLEGAGPTLVLCRGLRDEVAGAGERVTRLLALLHDPVAVTRGVVRLGSPVGAERGLALEMLEVTIGRATTPLVLAVVDPRLDDEERRRLLTPLGVDRLSRVERLRELVEDPDGVWGEPWLRACALHALGVMSPHDAAALARRSLADDPLVREVAAWVLTVAEPLVSP